MKRYKVTLPVTGYYEVTVKANSKEQAIELAETMFDPYSIDGIEVDIDLTIDLKAKAEVKVLP